MNFIQDLIAEKINTFDLIKIVSSLGKDEEAFHKLPKEYNDFNTLLNYGKMKIKHCNEGLKIDLNIHRSNNDKKRLTLKQKYILLLRPVKIGGIIDYFALKDYNTWNNELKEYCKGIHIP